MESKFMGFENRETKAVDIDDLKLEISKRETMGTD